MAVLAKIPWRTLCPLRNTITNNQNAVQTGSFMFLSTNILIHRTNQKNTALIANQPMAMLQTSTICEGRRLNNPAHDKYDFSSTHGVKKFIKHLQPSEIENLFIELQQRDQKNSENETDSLEQVRVTKDDLKSVFWFNFVPFVAFGFLDNAIMIMAGEFIEINIGLKLGISTMAAAAWGNIISDVAGIGTAGYVEMAAAKMGLKVPDLTVEQSCLTSTRVTANLGKGIGIVIGCILGMIPLLFMNKNSEDKSDEANN